jgi:hypothetical protein
MIHGSRRSHRLWLALSLYGFSLATFAGWQVSKPEAAVPREPFFQAGTQEKTAFKDNSYSSTVYPNKYASLGQPAPVFAVSISGSVKENLERIMGRYHWKVIWKAPYDYNFDGQVTGASLPSVVEKLLQPFPLQAVMYMSNRTVAVVSRMKT